MSPDPKGIPPVRIETLKKYAKSVFDPIKRGESVTCVWVPMAGRRRVNNFILANTSVFADIIGDLSSYLLVYLDPLELTEENLSGYLRLMGKSILEVCQKSLEDKNLRSVCSKEKLEFFSDDSVAYIKLLGGLKSLLKQITDRKVEIVLFLGKFDELSFADSLFYNNLRSLWGAFQPSFHYVFLVREDVSDFSRVKKFGELVDIILQNLVYTPLLDDEDIGYLIKREEKRLKEKFRLEEKNVLKEVCGSHPYFLKLGCIILSQTARPLKSKEQLEEKLRRHYQLRLAAREVWERRNREEKRILQKIVSGEVKVLPENTRVLEKLRLVKKNKVGEYEVFSQIFKNAILGEVEVTTARKGVPRTLSLDSNNGAILLGERTVEEEFTRQEYEVLVFLLRNMNKLKTRDEISNVLWGEESYDKYSDWAIDQLMSKLRKKLKKLGINKNTLVTIRGRGYKLLQVSS
jgi:DNA-binding response OmpR family regulator